MRPADTQTGRIRIWLETHDGLCAMAPINWHPPIIRVAARIFDLKRLGYLIDAHHRCPIHDADHAYYQLAGGAGGRLF